MFDHIKRMMFWYGRLYLNDYGMTYPILLGFLRDIQDRKLPLHS